MRLGRAAAVTCVTAANIGLWPLAAESAELKLTLAPAVETRFVRTSLDLASAIDEPVVLALPAEQSVTVRARIPDNTGSLKDFATCKVTGAKVALADQSPCREVTKALRATRGAVLEIVNDQQQGAELYIPEVPAMTAVSSATPIKRDVDGFWEPVNAGTMSEVQRVGGRVLVRSGTLVFSMTFPSQLCADSQPPLTGASFAKICSEQFPQGSEDDHGDRADMCVDMTDLQLPKFCVPSWTAGKFACGEPSLVAGPGLASGRTSRWRSWAACGERSASMTTCASARRCQLVRTSGICTSS